MLVLKNWTVLKASIIPCRAPEKRPESLQGQIYGHRLYPDGTDIVTRSIVGTIYGLVLVKKNHGGGVDAYLLGDPTPEYEAKFPDAKQRLLSYLQEKRR